MENKGKNVNVNALECPNCGGNIDVTHIEGEYINCSYCGTTLHIPRTLPAPQSEPDEAIQGKRLSPEEFQKVWDEVPTWLRPIPEQQRAEVVKRQTGSWIAASLIFSILLVVGILFITGVLAFDQLPIQFPESYAVIKTPFPLPEAGGAVLILRSYGETDHNYIGFLDLKTQKLRWKTEVLSDNLYSSLIAAGDNLIFLNDKSNLYTFQLQDGKLAWKQSLTNGISTSCSHCLSIFGTNLVALAKDGVMQAFQIQSGTPTWNLRLNTSPNQLMTVNGSPAVIDRDENKNEALFIYNIADGKLKNKFQPVCPTQGGKQRASDFWISQDGSAVFALYSYLSSAAGCVQRYDAVNLKLGWERIVKEGEPLSSSWRYSSDEILETPQGLLFYKDRNSRGMGVLDFQKGDLRLLPKEPRYQDYKPVGLQGQIAIVTVSPDYDSNEHEVWGIDLGSGKRKWLFKLSKDLSRWQVHLTPVGVAVIQCLEQDKQSVLDMLDATTGVSSGRKSINNESCSFLEDAWTSDIAYLVLDTHIYVVDLSDGSIIFNW